MRYKQLRLSALFLLIILFVVLSNAVRQAPQPVMQIDDAVMTIEALNKSVHSIGTIEYKQIIKSSGLGGKKSVIEMHYYYRKPSYLRVETKSNNNFTIDIYNTNGMYECFPDASTAYFREKWKDNNPVYFQLEDKIQDIMIRGKYDLFKSDKLGDTDTEVIRSVDDDSGKIYEHRIWMAQVSGLKLPVMEEYLSDGEVNSIHEYEYISINRELDNSLFDIKSLKDINVYNSEGIPKLVKDEEEAEEYVKFNVCIPKYAPENFKLSEICVIPPVKAPCVLVSYLSDTDTIYVSEKKLARNELIALEGDKTIKAGGKRFAVRKLFDESISVRWVKDSIEFEVSGPYTLKNEIIKLTHDIAGVWITIE